MQLYKIIEGAYLGFYQERGGTVFISGYRTVTESQWICRMVTEEYLTPSDLRRMLKFIPGHYESRSFTVMEHYESKTRTIPGHHESKTETTPAHWGTREYWLEQQIEIQYRFVGTAEQRAGRYGWEQVNGEWEFVGTSEQRAGRAGWESYEVVIPGCWEERRIWFPDVTRTYKVWIPEHEESYQELIPEHQEVREMWIPIRETEVTIEYGKKLIYGEHMVCAWEDVVVERPIYSYYGEYDEYDLVGRERGPVMVIAGPPAGDKLRMRIIESGDIIDVEAEYLGIGTRTDDNKYVLPVREPKAEEEERPLTEEELEDIKWGD